MVKESQKPWEEFLSHQLYYGFYIPIFVPILFLYQEIDFGFFLYLAINLQSMSQFLLSLMRHDMPHLYIHFRIAR